MAITDLPRVGSVQETADYFNVSTKTVRRWITLGLIKAERVGPNLSASTWHPSSACAVHPGRRSTLEHIVNLLLSTQIVKTK
jgi:hypothetical protein